MANVREKMAAWAQPMVHPTETIQFTMFGQTGPNPLWVIVTWLILIFGSKYRVIVVTDLSIKVYSSSMWRPARPKELLQNLPRQTLIGPAAGLWSKCQVGAEQIWIHKRFVKDVEAANAAIGL